MPPQKVLVTGGTGFLGSSIVQALTNLNPPSPSPSSSPLYAVTALDINPPALGIGAIPSVSYVRANILDPAQLRKVFEDVKPDAVIHTVAISPAGQDRYSMSGKKALFEVNVGGTMNVVTACREAGVKALVHTSSVTVLFDELDRDFANADETWTIGRARTKYAMSKTESEHLVLSSTSPTLRTCALRLAPIFGPHDPIVVPTLHACIARHETPFILGPATNLQDYIYVSNAADAHVLALQNLLSKKPTAAGEAFFVTNGEPVSVRHLCLFVWKQFGHVPGWEVSIPEGLAWWSGLGAEMWGKVTGWQGTFSRGVISDAVRTRYVSIAKARRVLGYEPKVGLEEGLRITCEQYKQQLADRQKR